MKLAKKNGAAFLWPPPPGILPVEIAQPSAVLFSQLYSSVFDGSSRCMQNTCYFHSRPELWIHLNASRYALPRTEEYQVYACSFAIMLSEEKITEEVPGESYPEDEEGDPL